MSLRSSFSGTLSKDGKSQAGREGFEIKEEIEVKEILKKRDGNNY